MKVNYEFFKVEKNQEIYFITQSQYFVNGRNNIIVYSLEKNRLKKIKQYRLISDKTEKYGEEVTPFRDLVVTNNYLRYLNIKLKQEIYGGDIDIMKYKTKIINKGNTIYNSETSQKKILEYSREKSTDGAIILITNNEGVLQEYINKQGRLFAQKH